MNLGGQGDGEGPGGVGGGDCNQGKGNDAKPLSIYNPASE